MQIIDNGDAGFSTIGDWTPYGGQGYLSDVHYTDAGSGAREARWTANVAPGQYRVAVTWSALNNRATNAPYTVWDGSTSFGAATLNQQIAPADFVDQGVGWKTLGTFTIAGNTLVVTLTDNANWHVIADAVRVERLDSAPRLQRWR